MSALWALRTFALLGLALTVAAAWAQSDLVPYTVQVAALSDQDAAIDMSTALLRDGFPAYVVRAEGAAGSVFRVRAGAFGDRASAERYAEAMAGATGTEPRPALAEAIPSGILPLAPTRWFRAEPGQHAVLIEWGDGGVAARLGPKEQAGRYVLPDGSSFVAWWARSRSQGGRSEVAEMVLDGDATSDDAPSVREALFRQRMRLVADRAGLDADRVEALAVRGEPGDRRLVVWRVVSGRQGAEDAVMGVALAATTPTSRAASDWLGEVPPDPGPPLLVVAGPGAVAGNEADEPAPAGDVAGDGWVARPDGPWTVLEVGTTAWRALVGAPRGALGELLILAVDGGTDVVRLRPR